MSKMYPMIYLLLDSDGNYAEPLGNKNSRVIPAFTTPKRAETSKRHYKARNGGELRIVPYYKHDGGAN